MRALGQTALAGWVAAAGCAGAADFAVDPAHASIHFAVSHEGISYVSGRFTNLKASVQYDPDAKTGTVVADVDAASVDTGNRALDGVLRSAQFLDTDTFADVRFVGERFAFDGSALSAVEGSLWLHGVQRPVTLTVERFVCKDVAFGLAHNFVCGGAFHTTLKRSDFGMTRFLGEVGDEVRLEIYIEAIRK